MEIPYDNDAMSLSITKTEDSMSIGLKKKSKKKTLKSKNKKKISIAQPTSDKNLQTIAQIVAENKAEDNPYFEVYS